MIRSAAGLQSVSAPPSAERIRETVQEVVAEGPYYLEGHHHFQPIWMQRVQAWILELLEQFLRVVEGVAPAGTLGFYLVVTALIAILSALMAHIIYTMYLAMRPPAHTMAARDNANSAASDHKPIVEEARELAAGGRHGDATRVLFRAALTLLEAKRGGRIRKGLTNREYLRTFRSDWVVNSLKPFVEVLDRKWYRSEPFQPEDFQRCETALENLEQALEERGL
ncbi:MAG: DUF4129 domain-containing protein [Candidatus Hydrogenedentota bacterium]